MEDEKSSFSGAVYDEKLLVDMSLHPTPSEEMDPLKFHIKKEVEVDDRYDGKENCYSDIVIKEEVDLQSTCDLSWQQTGTVSVASEIPQLKHELINMDNNSTQFSSGNDHLTIEDNKTEEHKSDFDGFETYYNSNIVVTKEEDLGVDGPVCEPISICSAADIQEPDHKKLSGDSWQCIEEGSSCDVYICDKCHNVYNSKQQIEDHLTHHEYKCKNLHNWKDGYDCNNGVLNIESAGNTLRAEKVIQSKKSLSKDCHLVRLSDKNITGLIQSAFKDCVIDIYKENKIIPIEKQRKKNHICKYCKKTFSSSSNLKSHELLHTGVKPYVCKYCEKAFSHSGSLKAHEFVHTGIKPHVCKYCKKAFARSTHLKKHSRLHTGKKRYICSFCEKAFTRSSYLKIHEHIHTGIKPYVCKYCEKPFTRSYHLKRHEHIHTGVKLHICKYCNKSFIRSDSLTAHELIHTGVKPYICRYCGKVFNHSGNLKAHEFIHTGVKRHICKHCKKKFTHSSDLKKHERIHTGVKPYICKYCKKAFTYSSYLKRHETIHISENTQFKIV